MLGQGVQGGSLGLGLLLMHILPWHLTDLSLKPGLHKRNQTTAVPQKALSMPTCTQLPKAHNWSEQVAFQARLWPG